MIRHPCDDNCSLVGMKRKCTEVWSRNDCKGPWRQNGRIVAQAGTEVWHTCDAQGNCAYIYKHMTHVDEADVLREMKMQELATNAGLAPAIIQVLISKGSDEEDDGDGEGDEAVIIMEAMDVTMSDAIDSLLTEGEGGIHHHQNDIRDNIYDMALQARALLDKLHTLGVYHGDAHTGNFMLRGERWYLIDFGQTRELIEGLEDIFKARDLERICDYLLIHRHQHKDVYSPSFITAVKAIFYE